MMVRWYKVFSDNVYGMHSRTKSGAWKAWFDAAQGHGCDLIESKPRLKYTDDLNAGVWKSEGKGLDAFMEVKS